MTGIPTMEIDRLPPEMALADGLPMNTFCAWCNAPLGHTSDLEPGATTHGICPPCALRHFTTTPDPDEPAPPSAVSTSSAHPAGSPGRRPTDDDAIFGPGPHQGRRPRDLARSESGDRLGVESPGAGDSAPPACCAGQREPSVDQRDRATAHEGPGVAGPTADRIGDTGDRCAAGRAVSNVSDGSSSILVGWQCWCGRLNEPELTVCLFCGEPRESNHDQHAGVEDHPASVARALGSSPAAPRAGASHDTQGHSAESINASEIGVAISAVGLFVVIVVALVWAEMRLWGWF